MQSSIPPPVALAASASEPSHRGRASPVPPSARARRVAAPPRALRSLALSALASIALVGPGIASTATTTATAIQSLESIQARAVQALLERAARDAPVAPESATGSEPVAAAPAATVEVVPLDRRLRLTRCAAPLSAIPLDGASVASWGAITVEVACPVAPAWRVRVRARVVVEREAWVLRRPVRRDEPLERTSASRETVRLGAADGPAGRRGASFGAGAPLVDLDARLGERFVRALPAGAVLDARDLQPALMVRRGAEVRLHRETGGLSVETRAVALADARRGDRVTVRNRRSGRRLDAVVTGPDEVVVR